MVSSKRSSCWLSETIGRSFKADSYDGVGVVADSMESLTEESYSKLVSFWLALQAQNTPIRTSHGFENNIAALPNIE